MRAYLRRVVDLPVAESLYNASKGAKQAARRSTLSGFRCVNSTCHPSQNVAHAWQLHERDAPETEMDVQTDGEIWTNVSKAPMGRHFQMTSEGFLEWSLWRHNVSIHIVSSWMFCKFSDAENTNATSRTCVPRFRKRQPCATLQCPTGTVDCVCPMTRPTAWCGNRCADACATAMSKAARRAGTTYAGNRTDNTTRSMVCPSACSDIGSFAATCEDVGGRQLDMHGEVY